MPRCSGFKPNGTPCERIVNASQSYCYSHDPTRQAERKRNAARGGKSKAHKDLLDVKERLRQLAEDVLSGEVDKGVGSVVSTIWAVYLRAISTELKVKEIEDLEVRLGELETLLDHQKDQDGTRRWGG